MAYKTDIAWAVFTLHSSSKVNGSKWFGKDKRFIRYYQKEESLHNQLIISWNFKVHHNQARRSAKLLQRWLNGTTISYASMICIYFVIILLETLVFPCLVLAIAARLAWVALSGNRDLFIPPPFTWITTSKKKMHLQPFALLLPLFTTLPLLIHNGFKPFLKENYLHFNSLEFMNLS